MNIKIYKNESTFSKKVEELRELMEKLEITIEVSGSGGLQFIHGSDFENKGILVNSEDYSEQTEFPSYFETKLKLINSED